MVTLINYSGIVCFALYKHITPIVIIAMGVIHFTQLCICRQIFLYS